MQKKNRKSIRLKDYNYTQPGNYFITACTIHREPLFGVIRDQTMILNAYGEIVLECWKEIPSHFPHVATDAFVVMPDHIHGIITIVDSVEATPVEATPVEATPVEATPVGATATE